MRMTLLVSVVFLVAACASTPTVRPWSLDSLRPVPQETGTSASLRGLCAVSDRVAWASGSGGTCLRTVDGGDTWEIVPVPGASEMDFRDVHGFDARSAVLLVAGQPARLMRTEDAGATWTIAYEHPDPAAFFDALHFEDSRRGMAFSDPVGGTLLVVSTTDGGRTWSEVPEDRLPRALEGEAGFAASGSCLVTRDGTTWIGLGGETGAEGARVLRSDDGGDTWQAFVTPMRTSASAGIFSLDFADGRHGVAVGGQYDAPEGQDRHFAVTRDGGRTWSVPRAAPTGGYRSAVRFLPGTDGKTAIATGPGGTDVSWDGGRSWQPLTSEGWHAVELTPDGCSGWLSGSDGRIARIGPFGTKR